MLQALKLTMNLITIFDIAMDMNGPPGLTHPLLVENYFWVDKRLSEMSAIPNDIMPSALLPPFKQVNYNRDNYLAKDIVSVESYVGRKRKRSESNDSDYDVVSVTSFELDSNTNSNEFSDVSAVSADLSDTDNYYSD